MSDTHYCDKAEAHAAALRRARGYRDAMRRALTKLDNMWKPDLNARTEAADILRAALPPSRRKNRVEIFAVIKAKKKAKRDMPGTYGP